MTTGIVSCLRLKACPCHLWGKMPPMSGSIAAVTANVPSSTKYAVRTALTMSFGRNLKSAKSPTKTALPIRGNLSASWKQQNQGVSTLPSCMPLGSPSCCTSQGCCTCSSSCMPTFFVMLSAGGVSLTDLQQPTKTHRDAVAMMFAFAGTGTARGRRIKARSNSWAMMAVAPPEAAARRAFSSFLASWVDAITEFSQGRTTCPVRSQPPLPLTLLFLS